jgi:hypothetical protein
MEHHSHLSEDIAALMGVSTLEFLSQSNELLITTNDYNICYYSM